MHEFHLDFLHLPWYDYPNPTLSWNDIICSSLLRVPAVLPVIR